MIYQAKEIISIRDHIDSVNLLHIQFPEQIDINVELAENNSLWGTNPEGSKIIEEKQLKGFYDKHGHFAYSKEIIEPTAIYFELEKGFELHDLDFNNSGLLKNILMTNEERLIYALYLTGSSKIAIQGRKVKSSYIVNLITSSPTDVRIRHIMFERSKLNSSKPVYSSNELLTINELADVLKINKRTLQNKISKGEILDPSNVAGSKRWKYEDVIKWIDDLRP